MRNVLATTLLIVMLAVSSSHAQQPVLQIYFDISLLTCSAACPGVSLDTLYVVARYVNAPVVDIAYKIDYGPILSWMGDIVSPLYTTVGYSAAGIEIQFPTPIDFGDWFVVQRAIILWNCSDCSVVSKVSPVPHPAYGELRVTEYPGLTTIALQPLSGRVCSYLDTEYSSWGRIKALFEATHD